MTRKWNEKRVFKLRNWKKFKSRAGEQLCLSGGNMEVEMDARLLNDKRRVGDLENILESIMKLGKDKRNGTQNCEATDGNVLLYSCKKWVTYERNKEQLRIWEKKFLKNIS